jgi:hypothetical protein
LLVQTGFVCTSWCFRRSRCDDRGSGSGGLVASMTATSTSKRPDADARSARYKRVAELKG